MVLMARLFPLPFEERPPRYIYENRRCRWTTNTGWRLDYEYSCLDYSETKVTKSGVISLQSTRIYITDPTNLNAVFPPANCLLVELFITDNAIRYTSRVLRDIGGVKIT